MSRTAVALVSLACALAAMAMEAMIARITAQKTALKKGRSSQKKASVIAASSRRKAFCCIAFSRPDTPARGTMPPRS